MNIDGTRKQLLDQIRFEELKARITKKWEMDRAKGGTPATDTMRRLEAFLAEEDPPAEEVKMCNCAALRYDMHLPTCPHSPDFEGNRLFQNWCSCTYEWNALTDVEKQRWNRLATNLALAKV